MRLLTLVGSETVINLRAGSTIGDLREAVEAATRVPMLEHRLILKGSEATAAAVAFCLSEQEEVVLSLVRVQGVSTIETDDVVSWGFSEEGEDLFRTQNGVPFSVKGYLRDLKAKLLLEHPGQIYLEPERFRSCRTSAEELKLLILQGLRCYATRYTDDIVTDRLLPASQAHLRGFGPRDCNVRLTSD